MPPPPYDKFKLQLFQALKDGKLDKFEDLLRQNKVGPFNGDWGKQIPTEEARKMMQLQEAYDRNEPHNIIDTTRIQLAKYVEQLMNKYHGQ